jgi:hypothetical protein
MTDESPQHVAPRYTKRAVGLRAWSLAVCVTENLALGVAQRVLDDYHRVVQQYTRSTTVSTLHYQRAWTLYDSNNKATSWRDLWKLLHNRRSSEAHGLHKYRVAVVTVT